MVSKQVQDKFSGRDGLCRGLFYQCHAFVRKVILPQIETSDIPGKILIWFITQLLGYSYAMMFDTKQKMSRKVSTF